MPLLSPPRRPFAKIFGSILSGIALLAAISFRPVDDSPYFETDYYRTTRERLAQPIPRAYGALLAGFGRASLTPQLQSNVSALGHFQQLPMAGYGKRQGRPAFSVHDSLFASAVAMRVGEAEVVMVSLDALIVSRAMAEGVTARISPTLGLRREHIFFGATHTHSSLGAWGEGMLAELFAGTYDPRALEWIIVQVASAIERAHADLSRASFAYDKFAAPRYVRNRLVGEKGGVDEQFAALVLRQTDGDQIILGAYSAHATVLTYNNMQLSSDYCGYWRRALEQQTRTRAVFFAGGVGSHGPQSEGEEFEAARFIGAGLADSVLARLPNLSFQSEATLSYLGVQVDLPELHMRVADDWRFAPWIAKQLVYEKDSYLHALRLNDVLWLGAPCDLSGEISARIKDYAQRHGKQAVCTSFNGSYVGYVIPSRYYHLDAYESRRMSFFGPYMGDYFEELLQRMMLALAEPQ